jgi:hypothetical protein
MLHYTCWPLVKDKGRRPFFPAIRSYLLAAWSLTSGQQVAPIHCFRS